MLQFLQYQVHNQVYKDLHLPGLSSLQSNLKASAEWGGTRITREKLQSGL